MNQSTFRVLFVCLGNICRSPLAEAIFKKKIKEKNLEHLIHADSCGTGNYHIGEQPDHRTISVAQKHGVQIYHHCRQLNQNDFQEFDLILAMDENNRKSIIAKGGDSTKSKIWLMREFDPILGDEVPDPYHGQEKEFQEVYEILDRSIEHLIQYLLDKKMLPNQNL